LPIASVTALSFHFLITLVGFIIVLAALGKVDYTVLPSLVIPVITLYLLVTTLGMFLALIDVYNRDLRRLLANLLTIWFFLIPIVYLQRQAKALIPLRYIDPANILVSEFRSVLAYQDFPPVHTMVSGLLICAALFGLALYTYHRFDDRLPREV
jgi:lipopolysaccharide transport system permease protein